MPSQTRTLCLAIIAKDEADRIARAIDSVPFADEVVVLDSGSADGTPEVARALGARVVRTDWPGFIVQKNRALTHTTTDLVLSLDADEWLSPRAQDEIRAVCAGEGGTASGWSFPRCSRWCGRRIRHGAWYPDRRVRLARRSAARWVGQEPVDRLEVTGSVVALAGDIEHDPYRNVSEHLQTIHRYTEAQARTMRAEGNRGAIWDPALHASWHVFDSLVLRKGFRDGWRGIALAGLGGVHSGLKWHRSRR